jgi:hypothetical protein
MEDDYCLPNSFGLCSIFLDGSFHVVYFLYINTNVYRPGETIQSLSSHMVIIA